MAKQKQPIILHETPRQLTVGALKGRPVEPIIVTAIVNPFGPTLNAVVIVTPHGANPKPRIVTVMLNPFSQEVGELGYVAPTPGEEITAADVEVKDVCGPPLWSCPTVVLLGSNVEESIEQKTYVSLGLLNDPNGFRRELDAVKKHFRDPWSRINEDVKRSFAKKSIFDKFDSYKRELSTKLQSGRRWVEQAIEYKALISDENAFREEMKAFLHAWQGAIDFQEKNGIKFEVMTCKDMLEIAIPLLSQCNLPAPLDDVLGPGVTTAPSRPTEAAEIKASRRSDGEQSPDAAWTELEDEELAAYVTTELLLYGLLHNADAIPKLRRLYPYVVQRLSKEDRLQIQMGMIEIVESGKSSALAFLPIVICDPDVSAASTATINLLATSELMKTGLPYGLMELYALFERDGIANKGAVFGAVAAFGDKRIRISLDILKAHLDVDDVQVAATISTGLITNSAMDFWLSWAEELVDRTDPMSEGIVGYIASALVIALRRSATGSVVEIERHYPSFRTDEPIRVLQDWSHEDYAQLIADRLYDLEARERPPKVFSHVLQSWNLPPRAKKRDQFHAPEK